MGDYKLMFAPHFPKDGWYNPDAGNYRRARKKEQKQASWRKEQRKNKRKEKKQKQELIEQQTKEEQKLDKQQTREKQRKELLNEKKEQRQKVRKESQGKKENEELEEQEDAQDIFKMRSMRRSKLPEEFGGRKKRMVESETEGNITANNVVGDRNKSKTNKQVRIVTSISTSTSTVRTSITSSKSRKWAKIIQAKSLTRKTATEQIEDVVRSTTSKMVKKRKQAKQIIDEDDQQLEIKSTEKNALKEKKKPKTNAKAKKQRRSNEIDTNHPSNKNIKISNGKVSVKNLKLIGRRFNVQPSASSFYGTDRDWSDKKARNTTKASPIERFNREWPTLKKHLFNVRTDPDEKFDLMVTKPEVVEQLRKRLLQLLETFVPRDYPTPSSKGKPSNHNNVWSTGWC